jgi:pimeloyl-ACP methyl ester carboxylesterase
VNVLLLHALPLDERMWEPQLPALAEHDVKTPCLYGRGPTMTAWAESIAAEIGGEHAVVGASMGGYCALACARRAPERILGMALIASRADADSFERRRRRQELIYELRRGHRPDLADDDADLEELAVAQEAMRDRLDLTGVLASFGGPVLVCVGDRDELLSVPEAEQMAATALNGRLEVFPDAGHFVALDQPERFNEVLLDFLSQWKT